MGLIVNLIIRITIFYFLGETLLFPDDPRFAGKAIPIRNTIIVLTLSLLLPFLHLIKKRWRKYPVWLDNLYLSIFWLDMAGNSFNLYNTYFYFDLLSHFHGTGATAVVLLLILRNSLLSAAFLANTIHALLEVQEYYTDVFWGTHNVRGFFDTAGDLVAGILGTAVYLLIYLFIRSRSVNLSNQKIKTR